MDIRTILEHQIFRIGDYTFTISMVLGMALLWLAVWLALRFARRFIYRGLKSMVSDRGRRHSLFLIVQYLAWLLGVMGMFRVLSLDISVLLAGSAAFLVGIGLGLQQIFRDIASGVFLLFEGTIEVGDVLQVDGIMGRVVEINLRTSRLQTRDGMMMIVPNNKFIIERVSNWNRHEMEPSRFSVAVTVGPDADERLVSRLLLDCATEHPDVTSSDPAYPVLVQLAAFSKSEMVLELHFWTRRKFEVEDIRSDLRYAIREKFRLHGLITHLPGAVGGEKTAQENPASSSADKEA